MMFRNIQKNRNKRYTMIVVDHIQIMQDERLAPSE